MYVAAPWFELSVLMEIWCQRWCFCHVKICVGRFHFSPLCLFLLLARAHGLSFLCICLCLRPVAVQLRSIFILYPWWFSIFCALTCTGLTVAGHVWDQTLLPLLL